jgi:anthranilate synthase/aminodeoxychorismate synthase-like glutamine amidotransferase
MILMIDNYDSFTFNLVHYLGDVGARCEVWRNDAISVDAVLAREPEAIVLSPGPCTPDDAGICLDLIAAAAGKVPILGVCLGHQAVAQAFGGIVVRAPAPMHGKLSRIFHDGTDIMAGIASPFSATRYHSLIVDRASLPDGLIPTAWTDDGLVMALRHRAFPIFGVQFHPESIASEAGHDLLANFLAIIGCGNRNAGASASAA